MTISIITVTYNAAATLASTMESVLSQTYPHWEHIIVDGHSQDDTLAIIKRYESRYQGRLRWVSEPDRGIYDAINKGIRMATGDVVGILNSDDYYHHPQVLQQIATALDDAPALDAVYGDVVYVNTAQKSNRLYSSCSFRPWKMRMGFMPAHPSFYCRKQCYEQYGYYDPSYRIAGDFELLLRMIKIGHIHTQYLPMLFVTMRQGGASSSGVRSHLTINREHLRALSSNHIYSNIALLAIRYIQRIGERIADLFRYNIIK